MGWYAHPDTLIGASADGAADRSGHARDTAGWLRAYREAYASVAGKPSGEHEAESLREWLATLDHAVSEADAGRPPFRSKSNTERTAEYIARVTGKDG